MAPNGGDSGDSNNQPRVLQGYQRKGKRFIPPFLQVLNLRETNWMHDRLPELVWIALLHQVFGVRTGTTVACSIATAASLCDQTGEKTFAVVSDYATLSPDGKRCVREALWAEATLQKAQRGLAALANHYRDFPMAFVVGEKLQGSTLADLRKAIDSIRDRESRAAMLAQATVVYIAVINDKLKVAPGLSLENLSVIEDYPLTEDSLRLAGTVRSAATMLLTSGIAPDWGNSFWSQGRSLEPCEVS